MAEQRDVFKLLAKLSSVDHSINSSVQEAYERIFSYVNEDLTKIMNDSSFTQKSNLRARLDFALANVHLFLRYPFLYGKTAIGIITGKAPESINFIRQLQNSRGFLACDRQRNLPYVIYNDSISNRISATNRADNLISLSTQEYLLMSNLYKENINPRDLVKSLSFSALLHHKYINYVVLPRFADTKSREFSNLTTLCKLFFIIHEDTLDYKRLPPSVVTHSGPLYIVATPRSSSAQEACKFLSANYPWRNVQLISPDEAISVCDLNNHPQKNFILHDETLSLLLKLRAHQTITIKRHTENIELLARETIFADDLNSTIKTLRLKEIERRDYEENMQKQIEHAVQNVVSLVTEFENALKLSIPNEILDMLTSPHIEYSSDFADVEGQIVLLALKCGDQALAGRYLNKLEMQDHTMAYIYQLYYSEATGANYPSSSIARLQNDTSITPVVLHAKIHFCDALQLSLEDRDKLASKLVTRDPDEQYYAACHLERTEGKAKARMSYAAAFDAGSVQAGERLAEYFLSEGAAYSFDMKRLSDALIPKAAFEYGKACLENKRYAQGVTYLRISVALNYTPAVLFYSDYIFEKALQNKNANDIQTAILLYLFISKYHLSIADGTAKLGILYHLQGDFVRAKQCFDQDCSLPEACFRLGSMYYHGDGVAKDWELAKKYLLAAKQQGNHSAGSLFEQIQGAQTRGKNTQRSAECKKSTSGTKTSYSSYKKGTNYESTKTHISSDEDCFITTATCRSEGRPDDCEELTAFRKYRDETLILTDEGKALIAEYYRIAPSIVEYISHEDNAEEIYSFLFSEYIKPGYKLLQQGRGEEAKKLYAKGVIMLANKYDIPLTVTIAENTIEI